MKTKTPNIKTTNDSLRSFPFLPSHTAYTLQGLCLALADTLQEEGTDTRRALIKANSLATAAELFAHELAHFFGSRMGDDHDQLEAIQDRYVRRSDE